MNSKAPLLEAVLNYKRENNIIFSMPGNKSGDAFLKDEIGTEFAENMGYLDITEVEPLDNFHEPEGVIDEAQKMLSDLYKVKKAYFLVNGSSSGNLISIFSAFSEGDEVLVERNCHKSIYNALILRKLKVIYIDPVIDEKLNIMLPPNEKKILSAFNKAKKPKGIIITSPSYYGIAYDVRNVLSYLKTKNIKIVIDGAHGAHYIANDRLLDGLYDIADYMVVSAHKTLPALTGGAYLLQNEDNDRISFYISSFITTSPSYLIMSSLDYARYYLQKYGKADYDELIDYMDSYIKEINSTNKVKIICNEDLIDGYNIDPTRIVMMLNSKYNGEKLLRYLREKHIQCEMSFKEGVVLILSPCNYKDGLIELKKAIEELNLNTIRNEQTEYSNKIEIVNNKKVLEPYEVIDYKYYECNVLEAEGKVSKDFIAIYPPGIPLVNPGEIISEKVINILLNYVNNNMKVLGVNNNRIKYINL